MIAPQIGRYKILEEIGKGGMGTVYRGIDEESGKAVAIKQLRSEVADASKVERFKREGEILRRLNHPNIVQMLDAVESSGEHYLIMELIEGGSLADKFDQTKRMEIPEILALAIEIVDALTRAHHLKVIHRDIKPANVLIATDGTPRLTDFGIARVAESGITQTGSIIGTLNYISPEILQGKNADSLSDIWSFGVMLFEMLTGTLPFKGGDHMGVIVQSILNDPLPEIETLRPDAPVELIDLIYRMLARDPAERIPSFRLVGAELEAIGEGRSLTKGRQDAGATTGRDAGATTGGRDARTTSHNLPVQTTPFLGRVAEITALKKMLEDAETRLITILAPGGMGKTRLALEVAGRMKNHFDQGVMFVPLARITSAEFVTQTIAEELGLPLSSQEDPKVQLLNYLKNSEILLVLDNFEHVLEGANIVQEILESAPHVKILATSRERLNLQTEVPFPLPSMSIADWNSAEEAMTYSAAQLFVQGAKRLRPDFALQQEDVRALGRICRFVEGMPLAILLASAWVDMLSLNEIATEMEKSIDFLETEMRDVPERQRSVRSVLESTWRRLDDSEQELFTKLSVFRSSFSRDAAQEVAGATLRGLSKLLSKSLITRDAESGRYHIHELLRQFAAEQLKEDAGKMPAQQAHAAYFADFMKEAWTHLRDQRGKIALQEIHADIENVRAAWRYWLQQRNAMQLRKFMETFWAVHEVWSWFRPAIELAREAREELDEAGKMPALQMPALQMPALQIIRAYLLAIEGWFTSLIGNPQQGMKLARESYAIFQEQKSDDDLYLIYSSLYINAIFLNLMDEVEVLAHEMLQMGRESGNHWTESFALIWNSYFQASKGEFEKAEKYARKALAILESKKNAFGISVAGGIVLGNIYKMQGKFTEAKQIYGQGLAAARKIDYLRVIQLMYDSLGAIALIEGRPDNAYGYFLQSLKITFKAGQTREQLGSLRDIATVYKLQRKFESALELIAVVLHHPARLQNSLTRRESLQEEAERLRSEMEKVLSTDHYIAAWKRGQAMDLNDVVAALLKENQNAPTIETDSRS